MKKRMSRILSALLVSALVMSAGNVVQAEDGGASSTGKAKVEAEAIPQSQGTNVLGTMSDSSSVKEITTKATVSGSIPLYKVVTGAEKNVDIGKGLLLWLQPAGISCERYIGVSSRRTGHGACLLRIVQRCGADAGC